MLKPEFKKYRRIEIAELRPYIPHEDLKDVSVSNRDEPLTDSGGMIARNPRDHKDQWYINGQYVRRNFKEI